jgi:general secretion pathway protein L
MWPVRREAADLDDADPPTLSMSLVKFSPTRAAPRASLRLPDGFPEVAGPVRVWLHAAEGKVQHGQIETLANLPPAVRAAPLQVWLPAGDALLTVARVPSKSRARIEQALPYALEDQVIGDPETMDYRWVVQEDESLAVAVTAKSRLEAVAAALRDAGIAVANLCPATLAVPFSDGVWTAAWDGAEWLVRTGRVMGFVCPPALDGGIPPGIRGAIAEARDKEHLPERLLVLNAPPDVVADAWSEALAVPVESRAMDFWGHAEAGPINLMPRAFGAPGAGMQTLRRVAPAMAMLALFAVGWVAFNGWELYALKRQHEATRAEMLDLFKKSFPEAKSIVDPALQMARNLSALQAGGGNSSPTDLLPMLTQTATALGGGTHPRAIQYADGGLTLDVTVGDFQAMETLRTAIASKGLDAEVANATNREGKVEGRLRVSAGGKRS